MTIKPPRPGSLGDKALKGTIGATAGMATGSMLTTVGAAGLGGTITAASASAVGTAATALSAIPVVGSAAATGLTTVATGAAIVGSAVGTVIVFAAPFALAGAAGYGLYRLIKKHGK